MRPTASVFFPNRSSDFRRLIDDTLIDIRAIQGQGGDGPRVLCLVNELAGYFEDLFEVFEGELRDQDGIDIGPIGDLHEAFLADYCDLAEDIRANNGEIPNAFFALVESGPYTRPSLAA